MLRSILATIAALIILSTAFSGPSSAAGIEWPGLLGPQRNGWVSNFQPPTQWPAELKKAWQIEVGTGYPSPLVSGGFVYQHARQGENEVVRCIDLKTGELKWRRSYSTPFQIGGGGENHGKGPKSSPALADGRLFTLSITNVLSAWDADSGELLWRRDYGSRFKASHGGREYTGHPWWGAATSPLVDGGRVIVHFGADSDGALIALDANTGNEVWTQGKDGPHYASPILVEIQGTRQVVEWNERALVGVESATGRLLWEYPAPGNFSDQNMPAPVFHQGRVLLGAENRGIRSLEPQVKDGVWTIQERWFQKKVALDMSTAVINDGLLYGFSHYDGGRIFCLDPQTGDVLWEGPPRTGQNVRFLAIPGHVVALINDGELQIVGAIASGFNKVASYQVAEDTTFSTWAPPVLVENGVLIKDKQMLTLWTF